MPIQVEASGWSGAVQPMRAKLSARFGGAMALLIEQSGDAFFKGRMWLDRGLRYPESDAEDSADETGADESAHDGTMAADSEEDHHHNPIDAERRAITAALAMELADVEAAYPDDRLAGLVHGSKAAERAKLQAADVAGTGGGGGGEDRAEELLSLQMVDTLIDEEEARMMSRSGSDEAETGEDGGPAASVPTPMPLRRLAAFVATGRGMASARRNAIAYLGSTAGRGGDAVFAAIAVAFRSEKSAGLRRTAGDALSDLGDPRAVPLAITALADDRSTLVRWRAARILGELGEGGGVAAALKQAQFEETAFEVAFEIKDAARKVARRNEGGEGGSTGPMWRQIREGLAGDEATN